MLAILALYLHHLMIGTKWLQQLLLYGGALCHLLICNLEGDEVHRVWHIRAVFHTSVEIQQAVMGIQATKQKLHAKLLCTDMLNAASVILIDSLHHQFYKYGRLVAKFLKVNVRAIAWQSSVHW